MNKMFIKKLQLLKPNLRRQNFSQNLVKINYKDLIKTKNDPVKNSELFTSIETAYGKDGLGLMVIEQVPKVLEAKTKLFHLIYKLVSLPPESLKKVERPDLNYSLGWSHGKEYLNDKPDFLKASYYAQLLQYNLKNPIDNNVWPQELPELKGAFFELGNIIRDIGFIIFEVVDSYIKSVYPNYNLNYRNLIEDSKENTGRMLYYYPKNKAQNIENIDADNWCEWHNDHGSLTGLASATYIDEKGNESLTKLYKTGLYIQNRKGEIIRVTFGKDDIAYQLGETLQIHSGGILHATPHAVKVLDDIPNEIGRVTFALFMEPNKNIALNIPEGADIKNVNTSNIYKVAKIQDRFKQGMNFGEFVEATYSKYYK